MPRPIFTSEPPNHGKKTRGSLVPRQSCGALPALLAPRRSSDRRESLSMKLFSLTSHTKKQITNGISSMSIQ